MAGPSGTTPKLQLPYPTPDDTVDVPRDIQALATKLDTTVYPVPVGSVVMWLAPAAPSADWLMLQGQTNIPAASYPLLIPILGETGGASSMLVMPDMRQRFPVGAGTGHALKGTGGASTVTLTGRQSGKRQHNHGGASGNNASLAHDHNVIDIDQGGGDLAQNGGLVMVAGTGGGSARAIQMRADGAFAIGLKTSLSGTLVHSHSIPNDAEAAALDPHENEPLWLAVNFIIRGK